MFVLAAPPPSGAPATLSAIVAGLCHAAAARAPRQPVLAALILLLWGRLRRTADRFTRLAGRIGAGTLKPPRRRPGTRAAPAATDRTPAAAPRLPQGQGWLLRLVPEAAAAASQLRHLLDQPEMQALLDQAPQAGRLLRPLCRMLAIQPLPPQLRPPPRPAAPPARSPRAGRRPRPGRGPGAGPAAAAAPGRPRYRAFSRLSYSPGVRPIRVD